MLRARSGRLAIQAGSQCSIVSCSDAVALPFVDLRPDRLPGCGRERVGVLEQDGLEALWSARRASSACACRRRSGCRSRRTCRRSRGGHPCPHTRSRNPAASAERQLARPEDAVGLVGSMELRRRAVRSRATRFERRGEVRQRRTRHGQAGRVCMAAEAGDESGHVALATRSSASRKWKPSIERPEPLSSPPPPRANTIAGRWNRSLRRDATMPTTPWCHSSR